MTIILNLKDEKGLPFPDANVFIDNVAIGSTTSSGQFVKPAVYDFSIISITSIGYKPVTFVANKMPTNITMEVDTTLLNEVNVEKKQSKWLIWLGVLALGYVGYNYSDNRKKGQTAPKEIVKATI